MVNILVIYDDFTFKNRIEYTFNFIFKDLIDNNKVKLFFNENCNSKEFITLIYSFQKPILDRKNLFWIPSQKFIFSDKIIKNNEIYFNKYKFINKDVFSIEKNVNMESDFFKDGIFSFDFIETIFFHISRYEEYYALDEQRDHHSRMKSAEQILVKNKLEKIPIIDELVLYIYDILNIFKDGQKTLYSISHDIDAIRKFPSFYKFTRAVIRILIKDKNLKKIFKLLLQYIVFLRTKKDPYDTFEWLLRDNKSEEKVIYFMSGGVTKYDNFYSIYDENLKNYYHILNNYNYTIGLHPSYATWTNNNQFKKELLLLESVSLKKIIHSRQHILHFSQKHTLNILEKNHIQYDSSIGYEDRIGFRSGTGKDYLLYNLNKERVSTVKEIPLVVMDGPLLMEAGNDIDKAEELLFGFLTNNRFNTKITFNFHNSTFDDVVCDRVKFIKLYEKINKYIDA